MTQTRATPLTAPARDARDALEELYAAARAGASDAGHVAAIDRAYRRIAPLVERVTAEAEVATEVALLDPFGPLLEDDADDAPLAEADVPWEALVPPAPARDPLAGDPAAAAIRGMIATIVREACPPHSP